MSAPISTPETDPAESVETPEVEVVESQVDESTEAVEGGEDEGGWDETRARADLAKKNRENKSLRDRMKALEADAAELKTLKDAQLSKEERLANELSERSQAEAKLQLKISQLQLQKDFPAIDDDLLEFIPVGEYEAMKESAEKLLKSLKVETPAPKPKTPSADALKGGTDPAGDDAETDPLKLVKRYAPSVLRPF